jgi:hypothetical protein
VRLSGWLTGVIAIAATAVLPLAAWALLWPAGPPLASASILPDAITPNADGAGDVTRIRYTLRRPANVSIYFLSADGQRYDFRLDKPRESGENDVNFSGIVNPYTVAGETVTGKILARVMPDGQYTWVIEARDARGATSQITGPLTVSEADRALPELLNLTVSPAVFTPNQDGLNDRAMINVFLTKSVPPEKFRVFLIGPDGAEAPLSEQVSAIEPGERGLHSYDYDGGIDMGQNPPPDGEYTVRAEAEDALGQRTAVTNTLTIADGGMPRADILNGVADFAPTTLVLGQTLYFTLTVENYGTAPIRTSGPPSGWHYDSMSTSANTLGWYEESGAFRVGVDCDTCIRDYPWRWALGTPDTLTARVEDGKTYYYLMPGQRAVVTGSITLDQIVAGRNPQYFWAGLIHEDVEIAAVNNRVDPHFILIEPP